MAIPNLKRVKVASERELYDWLAKQPEAAESVMLVTFSKASPDKYVSHERVGAALATFGWGAGRRYTLGATLVGHVIHKPSRGAGAA